MINPAHDVWVWATAALFLVLVAARARVVETGRTRLGRTSRQVKTLTGASAVLLVGHERRGRTRWWPPVRRPGTLDG